MPERWGLGPVFAFESLLNARRWQVYAGRSLFVAVLMVGMVMVWFSAMTGPAGVAGGLTFQQMAAIGEGFFYALAGVQISLVLLAAPAASAGSICMDRARGTLLHVMVTDLSDSEIVLGKLGSRLAPVFGLIACGVPVAALGGLLGGIDFGALAGLFVVSMALAVVGCSLAMAVSVRATRTHEVLMAVYLLLGLWLMALPMWWGLSRGAKFPGPPEWFQKANPYVLAFAPYTQPRLAQPIDYVVFAAAAVGFSAVLAGWSIARLRRAVVEEEGRPARPARRWNPIMGLRLGRFLPAWAGPTLDGNPVLWREWHRSRPSRMERRLWLWLFAVTWGLAVWGTYDLAAFGLGNGPAPLGFAFMIQLMFGMLMLSATAPTALAEERMRGSLDVLLATPLPTSAIVLAKWWGAYRRVLLLAVLPLYVSTLLAYASPDVPAYAAAWKPPMKFVPLSRTDRVFAVAFCLLDLLASGAMIVSLGVALATWVRRLGRALAISVIAFFALGIGWVFLMQFVLFRLLNLLAPSGVWLSNNRWVMMTVASVSPLYGPMHSLQVLNQSTQEDRMNHWVGHGVVILFKWAVAALLLVLTLKTFDRCLGRVSEPRGPAADRPRPLPTPADPRSLARIESNRMELTEVSPCRNDGDWGRSSPSSRC